MWRSTCCSVQGRGHKKAGIPCQDKTARLVKNDVFVIALADGAGSASLSHYGAKRVVRDVSEYIVEHFEDLLNCDDGCKVKKMLVEMLRKGLLEEAEKQKCNLRDLASTLLLAAVRNNNFILAHIGDGVIGYLDGDQLKVASMPYNGEFSNVTTFVTSSDVLNSMRLFKGELNNKDAFVLMSDGTEQSFYHKSSKRLAGVVKKLMHRTCLIDSQVMRKQLEDAFSSVLLKNTQDDCSIAILARPSKVLCPVNLLDFKARQELYGITGSAKCIKRRVYRYDRILANAQTPLTLKQIAKSIHLKPKHAKKNIERLVSAGLLQKNQGQYKKVY